MIDVMPHSGALVGEALLFEYLHHGDLKNANLLEVLEEAVGDFLYKCPVIQFAALFKRAYFYFFDQHTTRTSQIYGWPDWTGILSLAICLIV